MCLKVVDTRRASVDSAASGFISGILKNVASDMQFRLEPPRESLTVSADVSPRYRIWSA
jgi:hypothetical protein